MSPKQKKKKSNTLTLITQFIIIFQYVLLIMLLELSQFLPLCPNSMRYPPFSPASACISSHLWVTHLSYLVTPISILFLTFRLFFTYQFALLNLCSFPAILPLPCPSWKPSNCSPYLWFCSCYACLLSLFFRFSGW